MTTGKAPYMPLKAKPLESLKPTLPRTKENFHKVLRDLLQNVNLTY